MRREGAIAGAAAGAAVMLASRAAGGLAARRAVGPNFAWMSSEERKVARTLVAHGQGHLFKAWPKPGVNDAAKRRLLAAAASYLEGSGASLEDARLQVLLPPTAEARPKALEAHGDVREDPYYWLRDDARSDPAVLAYLKAENDYTSAALADTAGLQDELYREMRGRIQEADVGVATRYRGFYYYTRTEEGAQYALHARRPVAALAGVPSEADEPGGEQAEEVLLDENARKAAGKHKFYMVGCVEASPDQRLLAWSEDTVGGEKYTLHVKEIASGKALGEPIPMTAGDAVWANDNATLFYTVKDHLDRPYKVLRHRLGTHAADDVVVFEEKDEAFYVGIGRSHSDRLIYIHVGSAVTSETHYLAADQPLGAFRAVLSRVQDVEYDVSHHPGGGAGGWFLITYRDPTKPNSELRVAPVSDPSQQTVLLPHRADVKLEGASVGERWLVISERSRALTRLVPHALPPGGAMPAALGDAEPLTFDEPAYALSGGLTGDFESEVLRLRYSSLTTPPSVYDQHLGTGKRCLKKVTPILGGFDRTDYETRRLWATAPDGTEVPVSLVFRKALAKLDGTDPLLLHGYGSYEHSYDPTFSRDQLSLLDRGWTVAIAHVRGGGDMGRMWYEDGKYLKKKNSFTDFIACAEHLVAERYTRPDRLTIEGRSAGGLLMGAVTNMRPDLFNAVMMGVPFVDCLTTMLDESIPLTTIEWEVSGGGGRRRRRAAPLAPRASRRASRCAALDLPPPLTPRRPPRRRRSGARPAGAPAAAAPALPAAAAAAAAAAVAAPTLPPAAADPCAAAASAAPDAHRGNPQQPEYYSYMKSYSPVDNVARQDYPHILVTAGLHDPRVGYWEPAKLVAALRARKTDGRLLCFKCEMGAGHFSVTGRFERLKETAFEYAFLLKTAGLAAAAPLPGSAAAADAPAAPAGGA
ncbi:dapb1 [Scenedesmus sp. PABB004]|nr:dapb1 [Scenedesmus sp. PABB004]